MVLVDLNFVKIITLPVVLVSFLAHLQPRPQSVAYSEALSNRRILTSSTESREGLTQQVPYWLSKLFKTHFSGLELICVKGTFHFLQNGSHMASSYNSALIEP